MTDPVRVECINKTGRTSPHERINHFGGAERTAGHDEEVGMASTVRRSRWLSATLVAKCDRTHG